MATPLNSKVKGQTGSAGLQSPTRPHHLPTVMYHIMTVVGLEEHNLEQQKGIDVKIGGGPRVRYIENKPTPLTYYQ